VEGGSSGVLNSDAELDVEDLDGGLVDSCCMVLASPNKEIKDFLRRKDRTLTRNPCRGGSVSLIEGGGDGVERMASRKGRCVIGGGTAAILLQVERVGNDDVFRSDDGLESLRKGHKIFRDACVDL
jgi:hypothetical protein